MNMTEQQEQQCKTQGAIQSPPLTVQFLSNPSLKPFSRVSPLKQKQMTSPLKLNTYNTVFEKAESLSIVRNLFIPETATQKERDIHSFLSMMSVYQVNVKSMLEDEAKMECKSPRLQEEFNKVKRLGSPSFLAKRLTVQPNKLLLSTANQSTQSSPNQSAGLQNNSRSRFQFDQMDVQNSTENDQINIINSNQKPGNMRASPLRITTGGGEHSHDNEGCSTQANQPHQTLASKAQVNNIRRMIQAE